MSDETLKKFSADIEAIHEMFENIRGCLREEQRKNAALITALLKIADTPDSNESRMMAIKALTEIYVRESVH